MTGGLAFIKSTIDLPLMRDVIRVDKSFLFYHAWEHKTAHSHEYWQDVSVIALLNKFMAGFWTEWQGLLHVYFWSGFYYHIIILYFDWDC